MFRRLAVLFVFSASCAGCASSHSPSVEGKDALGQQIYSLGGDRLAALEATANSFCPGVTRPYVKSITGFGDNTSLTYTCE